MREAESDAGRRTSPGCAGAEHGARIGLAARAPRPSWRARRFQSDSWDAGRRVGVLATMDTSASRPDLAQLAARSRWLGQLARALVRDDATADDLVQETLRAAVEHPPAHTGDERGWLARVLANFARSRARSERDRGRRERAVARAEHVAGPDELVERAEAHRVLIEELLSLDEPYRATLLARFVEGECAEHIAALTGASASTVRTRVQRGLAHLRARLERRCGRDWTLALTPLVRDGGSALGHGAGAEAHGALHPVAQPVQVAAQKGTQVLVMSTAAKTIVVAAACVVALLVWNVRREERTAPAADLEVARTGSQLAYVEPASNPGEFVRTTAGTTPVEHVTTAELSAQHVAAASKGILPSSSIDLRAIEVLVRRSGQPLSDLHVWVAESQDLPALAEQADTRSPLPARRRDAHTGVDGVARFAELDPQPNYLVGVERSSRGVPAQRVTSLFVAAGGRCVIELGTSRLYGHVYDAEGRAAPNVRVRVDSIPTWTEEDAAGAIVATDADGRYEISDLAAGRVWVMVDPDASFDGLGTVGRYVDIEPGRDTVLDFGSPQGSIQCVGEVRNWNGDVLAGPGTLALRGSDGLSYQSVPIPRDGRFTIAVTAGSYAVNAVLPSLPERGVDLGTFEITAERSTLSLVVPGTRITGRALDAATSAPLAGDMRNVWVVLALDGGEDLAKVRRTRTDDDGEFVFDAVGPGAWTAVVDFGLAEGRDMAQLDVRRSDKLLSVDLLVRLK